VPGGSVKVRLVLSLATAPPLKKQRIARGAQPFEELMPQAEAAATAAAKAREDEPTAKRKEAAEGSATRKRKEAAAAAPPPSAHQTDADELSIAQRRKLERPKEAPAKASAPSPASAGAKEHFGFNSIKYAQEVGLNVVLDTAQKQRHLLFILPTGGGKSLIYQL
jgi:hypothetical protein